ncbi:MAG: hypothetical protein HY554_04280 [Elusimicrobia bacterium]|nr:hypothetical protein [Elusimicrobiota bacterium]
MEPKGDRPSQDELRSLFNDYLTGKRKVAPAPAPPPPRRPQPPRAPRAPKAARPAPPPKEVETLPPGLDPAQLRRLAVLKGSLPPPRYKRIARSPDLAKEPAAFFARWDRLLNAYGMKGAAAVLLGELRPEDACVLRLAQLLACDPSRARRLTSAPRFASLPIERRALAIRDLITQSAKRWDCPIEAVARAVAGELAESELAATALARKLRIEDSAAKILLSRQAPGDAVPRALELAQKLLQEAAQRRVALSEVVASTLESIQAEELLWRSVASELSIPADLAERLCALPAVRGLPPGERGSRVVQEAKSLAAELGSSPSQACRLLRGELPAAELDQLVGQAIAAGLSVDPAVGLALARHPEVSAAPAAERAKKAVRRVLRLADELRCAPPEAAGLLLGSLAPDALASILRARLALAEGPAEALLQWVRSQPGVPVDSVAGAIERVEETRASASCTNDQAALLVCGRLSLADLRAARLADELGISPELASRLVAWMDAEKVGDAEARARVRSLRSWAAATMEQACRMLLKELPTPTKSDSDALPFSGAWE